MFYCEFITCTSAIFHYHLWLPEENTWYRARQSDIVWYFLPGIQNLSWWDGKCMLAWITTMGIEQNRVAKKRNCQVGRDRVELPNSAELPQCTHSQNTVNTLVLTILSGKNMGKRTYLRYTDGGHQVKSSYSKVECVVPNAGRPSWSCSRCSRCLATFGDTSATQNGEGSTLMSVANLSQQ